MSIPRNRFARRLLAVTATGALAAGVLAATAPAAQAAERPVDGVSLTWSLSNEQGGGAFFGGCNYLSAGKAGDTGSSRLWTEADGFYKTADGDVTVEKPNSAGDYVAPTWSTKCQTRTGTNVSAASVASTSENRVRLSEGTGTIDAATGAGEISWEGSFTSVFYGGLTYWSASDPTLTIAADGTGTLTATGSGYGADMNDTSKWVELAPREITLAEFADVNVTSTGFTATPTYLGTAVESSTTPQPAKSSANEAYWGSFPQDFVDFQVETGQSSYWYTSGGSRDRAKPATPVTVSIPTVTPKVTVSTSKILREGTTSVTVTGTGFLPELSAPPANPPGLSSGGVYVALGRNAPVWKPSETTSGFPAAIGTLSKWALPASDSSGFSPGLQAGTTPLSADGSFSVTFDVTKAEIDAYTANPDGVLGIYTYTRKRDFPAFETLTPLTVQAQEVVGTTLRATGLPSKSWYYGQAQTADVTIAPTTGTALPSGTVTAKVGSVTVGEAEVVDGKAEVEISQAAPVGSKNRFTFSYTSTDGDFAAVSKYYTRQVKKSPASVALTVDTVPTSKLTGDATVTLTNKYGGPAPTGKLRLAFTKGSSKKTVLVSTNADGVAEVEVPKLSKGTWKVKIKYYGSSTHSSHGYTTRGSLKVTDVAPPANG